MELDFEIDEITESIVDTQTGERLETLVVPGSIADLKELTTVHGWRFDWYFELAQSERFVYKLIIENEPDIVQGLVSFVKRENEKLVYMPLIENAPFNIGENKRYQGVCGNLVAYGCKMSKECGFDGYLSFLSKTTLIEHYIKTLRAKHYGGQRMGIEPEDADWLIGCYFK